MAGQNIQCISRAGSGTFRRRSGHAALWWIRLFTLFVIAGSVPAQEASARKGAAVEGVILNALTGEPVRRAEVLLVPWRSRTDGDTGVAAPPFPPPPMPAAGTAPLAAVTAADGTFRLENVPDGAYRVRLQRQSMTPDVMRPGFSPWLIEVKGGAPVRGLRYPLAPLAVVSGRVVDEEDETVQGVLVSLLRQTWVDRWLRWTPGGPPATTDDRGEFRISGILPGRYILQALPPRAGSMMTAQSDRVHAPLLYPNAQRPEQAQVLTLAPGQELRDIRIRLPIVPARSIRGRAMLPDGRTAEQLILTLRLADSEWQPQMMRQTRLRPQPGKIHVEGMPPARYELSATYLGTPDNPRLTLYASAEVDLTERDVEDLELHFRPPAVLRGRVVIEGPDAENAGPWLQQVGLMMRAYYAEYGRPLAQIGPDGAFQMEAGHSGRYVLSVTGEALNQLYPAAIRTSSGTDARDGVVLGEGSSEQVTITLRTDGARLTVIRSSTGRPAEACAPWFAVLYDPGRRVLAPVFSIRELDSAGQAVFFPVAPGEYRLAGACAADGTRLADLAYLEKVAREGIPVRLKAGEQTTVELREIPLD